ncbi:hypothetical protein KY290_031714 [Solanum tuberosum]|uniref:Transposase MuDR plant domain-containing protein n=1 Tax=Solanum tuberosum TaxID=4113 RepID=A0ABQ7UA74_SOLTU|nr:hypothetical protein KY290_031714 [Solanum tuberosum]
MIEKVDLVFNYGGKWVLKPEVMYLKKLKHMMQDFDADLLSYIDICAEYTEKLGFSKVKQVLVNGPSGRYFLIENDACIIALQSLLCTEFNELQLYVVDENELFVPSPSIIALQPLLSNQVSKLQLYAIDEGELLVSTPNIIDQNERHNIAVDVGTNCDSSDEEKNAGLNSSDRDSEELELFRKERTQDVSEKLDKFLHLEKGMRFKDLFEAFKRVVGFYAIAYKVGLKVKQSDTTRLRYVCDTGCPFVCLISKDNKDQGFKIKTLETKHECDSTFHNRRATPNVLAHYFKNKV